MITGRSYAVKQAEQCAKNALVGPEDYRAEQRQNEEYWRTLADAIAPEGQEYTYIPTWAMANEASFHTWKHKLIRAGKVSPYARYKE